MRVDFYFNSVLMFLDLDHIVICNSLQKLQLGGSLDEEMHAHRSVLDTVFRINMHEQLLVDQLETMPR